MLPYEVRDGVHVLFLQPNPDKPRGGVVVLDAWLIRRGLEELYKVGSPCIGRFGSSETVSVASHTCF